MCCRYSAVQTCYTSLWECVVRCVITWIYTALKWSQWVSRHMELVGWLEAVQCHAMVRQVAVQLTRCCGACSRRRQQTAVTVAAAVPAVHVTSATHITSLRAHMHEPWDTLMYSSGNSDVDFMFYFVCVCHVFQALCLSVVVAVHLQIVSRRGDFSVSVSHVLVTLFFFLGVIASCWISRRVIGCKACHDTLRPI